MASNYNTSAPLSGAAGSNAPEGTYGPHSSRVANAADPRVDSDRDYRDAQPAEPGLGAGSVGAGAGHNPNAGHVHFPGHEGVPRTNAPAGQQAPAPAGAGATGSANYASGQTTATTTDAMAPGKAGAGIMKDIKGIFAQGHGIGENLRGNFNAAIDDLTGDKEGVAKNDAIARKGAKEIQRGEFDQTGSSDRRY